MLAPLLTSVSLLLTPDAAPTRSVLEELEQPVAPTATAPTLSLTPPEPPPEPEHFVHNRDSIPVPPDVVLPFDWRYEVDTRAPVGDGSVRVNRTGVAGDLVFGSEKKIQFRFLFDYEMSSYDFRNADTIIPGGANRLRNVRQAIFAPSVEGMFDEQWGIFGAGLLIVGGQYGSDFGTSTTYGGFGGVVWKPDKTLTLRLGLGMRTQLENDPQITPAFWLEWRMNERTRLTSQGNNIRFEYDLSKAWTVKLDAAYEQRAYRFDDDGPGASAVFRDTAVPVTARIEFCPHASLRIEGWAGVMASREFRVDLDKDVRFSQTHPRPSAIFGMSVEFIF